MIAGMKFIRVQRELTPEEKQRVREAREYYQREKPSPDDLIAEGGEVITMGEYWARARRRKSGV